MGSQLFKLGFLAYSEVAHIPCSERLKFVVLKIDKARS